MQAWLIRRKSGCKKIKSIQHLIILSFTRRFRLLLSNFEVETNTRKATGIVTQAKHKSIPLQDLNWIKGNFLAL